MKRKSKWDLKRVILKARELNNQIKSHNGDYSICISVSIYNENLRDWEHFNPYNLNLSKKLKQENKER